MMYLTRYDYNPVLDIVKNFWGETLPATTNSANKLTPSADVVEKEDKWLFYFDVPGINHEDINISVEADQLIVTGERQQKVEAKEEDGYVYTERMHGKFERRFALPESADRDDISAEIDDGVLTVTVTKRAQVQPRRIQVNKK